MTASHGDVTMLPGAHAHHRQLPAAVCNLILAAPGIFPSLKTCHQETFIMEKNTCVCLTPPKNEGREDKK